MLNPLTIKIAAIGALVAALAGLTIWALMERGGRLEAKVELEQKKTELQKSVDQVAVLAGAVTEQTASIDRLGQASALNGRELLQKLGQVTQQQAGTMQTVGRLETSIAAGQAKRADGTNKDCNDAMREWRAERAK